MNNSVLTNPNGFQTNVWGPGAWLFLHCVTLNYNEKYKAEYMNFFSALQHVLPCLSCRNNYKSSIANNKSLVLTDDVFKNRETLSYWLFKLHNYVRCKTNVPDIYPNNKAGFGEMIKFYEHFRAKCTGQSKKQQHTGCVKSYYRGMRLRAKVVIGPLCGKKSKHSIILKKP